MFNPKTYARGELAELEIELKECETREKILTETLNNRLLFHKSNIDFNEIRTLINDLESNQNSLKALQGKIQKIKVEFNL